VILTIELVPTTAWFKNVRSEVTPTQWDILRRRCYAQATFKCEVCGGRGKKWPVEAHEVWDYNDTTHVQKLVRLIALCPQCHAVKHIGRSQATSKAAGERALKHLMKVNEWPRGRANAYIQECYEVWSERSQYEWDLDISWLDGKLRGRESGNPGVSNTAR
jgi:hypothetical protein